MGDAAEPGASSALGKVSRTWQLILAPWSEAERAALRRFGNDESSVLLFALRTDGGKLEVFVTCKAPCRAVWLSTHVIEGEWRPAASPKTKGERCNLLAQYQECCDRSNQGQRANVPASAASPARPPEDREGLQAARPPEDVREDLGLPPLAAVSIEPRQHAPAPTPASMMFSLPPAQRTAAERAAAERAAKKACREERERRMCEEGERALWYEAARASTTWRRVHDPSDDFGGPPCPEACEPLFEAGDKVGEEADDPDEDEINRRAAAARRRQREADEEDYDLPSVLRAHPGDTSSDVYERWCDYGPELMRGRPYRPPAPQMPPKPPEPQPQEPPEHSAGAFEDRRDSIAACQATTPPVPAHAARWPVWLNAAGKIDASLASHDATTLRRIMAQHGMTQKMMAMLLGWNQNCLCNWLGGLRHRNPTINQRKDARVRQLLQQINTGEVSLPQPPPQPPPQPGLMRTGSSIWDGRINQDEHIRRVCDAEYERRMNQA
jgi:hypothetical protein